MLSGARNMPCLWQSVIDAELGLASCRTRAYEEGNIHRVCEMTAGAKASLRWTVQFGLG